MINLLFDRFWDRYGINPYGSPGLLQQMLESSALEEEVFEVVKGDYKTTIICKFNKQGFLVSHSSVSQPITDKIMENLKKQLTEALEKEDYEKAASIQKLINQKRNGDEQKPTI